jgi:thioredoxin-like negative regulator of GroEL
MNSLLRTLQAGAVLAPLSIVLAAAPAAFAALSEAAASPAPAAAHREVVPFIEDDFDRALAEAKRRNVPLIVDAWATWCHACRSMRAYVFTDPAVAPLAERAVWLALDVEKPQNAKARAAYPARALPTFFVVDPKDGSVATRWVGGMTVDQLTRFVADGEAALAATASPGEASSPLAKAERAYAAADYATAAGAFVDALATPPADPAADARAVEAALFSLSIEERSADGLAVARAALARLGRTTSGASAAAQGLGFALALPETTAGRAEAIAELEARTRAFLDDPQVTMSDDDRSGLLGTILSARQDAKDEAGAKKAAEDWAAFLEGAAARATTPEQRAVFDSHRLSAYLELGTPEKAVPVLEASERALPDDYNPPYRLAVAYNAMKRWDDALAASGRALPKAYGPRKLRIYTARADALAGRGDLAAAQATLDEGLAYARALPEGQASAATIAALQKKRDGLGAAKAN